jgi:hypothetical protein
MHQLASRGPAGHILADATASLDPHSVLTFRSILPFYMNYAYR